MCGLVGLLDPRPGQEIERGLFERMTNLLEHRGPDGVGFHFEAGVALGHRRLSIIDIAGGQQPMYNEDSTVCVVFNGEIYNFLELSKELEAAGHRLRSRCDTEVIVHAWEEWGERCVERFRGMFAFAVWDSTKRRLFLARDRLGIKPLYYAKLSGGRLLFASELKSLTSHPDLRRDIDASSVADYFALGYVPDPKSIFSTVAKLAPGHYISWRLGDDLPEPRQYWDVSFGDVDKGISDGEATEGLMERIRESVRIRLIADVPLGAFLSGGVDSSAVVALMAGLAHEPVNTCSISFGDPRFNESEYAQMVAERYSTRHSTRQVEPDDFGLLDRLSGIYDEPFADSSAIPTYRVCELAREHVTVALSGDGGDENFAGYRRYRWHMFEERFRSALPPALRRPTFGLLGKVYPKADWAPKYLRAKSTLRAIALDSTDAYFDSVSVLGESLRSRLFSDLFRRRLGGYSVTETFSRHARNFDSDDALARVQYLDLKTYLPGDILTKVDRASMANSLEVRVPLLDHKVVELAARLPSSYKLRGREGKYLFKKGLTDLLPPEVLYRSKMGFAVPLASWFRGPLKERVRSRLLGPTMRDLGFFDMPFVERLIDEHQSRTWDHSTPIWCLLMFEAFSRQNAQ